MARKKRGIFKKIGKTIGSGIKNIAKETGKAVKNPGKAIKNLAKGIVNVGSFTALLPFRLTMANHLKRKGISHNGKIDDIARKFVASIKKKNFESESYLRAGAKDDGLTCYYGKCTCPNGTISCKDRAGNCTGCSSFESESVELEDVKEIVRFVIDFFTNVKKKNEEGQISGEEKEIANDLQKDEKAIEEEVKKGAEESSSKKGSEESSSKKGSEESSSKKGSDESSSKMDLSDLTKFLPIVLVVIAIIFVMKKK